MNGEIVSMARDAYDRQSRVNWSTLRWMAKSPAHYRWSLLNDRPDTDALMMGRVIHLAVFEPERFAAEVCVYEDRKAGKWWEKFEKEHEGQVILKPGPFETAKAIGEAARRDALAADLLSRGKGEQTLLWSFGDIEAKGRVDFIAKAGIVDLKTTRDASPEAFGRQAAALQMHAQAAFYVDGYKAITGKAVPYFVVAVEKTAPFAVCVYQMSDDLLDAGRIIYEPLLDRLRACREANHWPGYSESIELLHLPIWAMPRDEDYEGLGLNFPLSDPLLTGLFKTIKMGYAASGED